MTNPILQELKRIAPDYVPSAQQIKSINAAKDPQKTARWLEPRVQDLREDAARYLGTSVDHVDLHTAIASIEDLGRPLRSKSNDKAQTESLGVRNIFEIGRASVAVLHIAAAPPKGFLAYLYEHHLGRSAAADSAGFKHYTDMLEDGVPFWQVHQYVELSPEAVARKSGA